MSEAEEIDLTHEDIEWIIGTITAVILDEPVVLSMADGSIRHGHAHPGDAENLARKIFARLEAGPGEPGVG